MQRAIRQGQWYFKLAIFSLLLFTSIASAQEWVYTVVPGDNLWNFCEKYLHKVSYWKKVQQINNIKRPKRMQPGTQVRVPMEWIKHNAVHAEVLTTRGKTTLIKADGARVEAPAPGTRIALGDQLETGPESNVTVRFADKSLITLHADSTILFDHLSAYGETGMVDSRLHLLKGRGDTRITPASGPGSRFEIRTPSAISAVRGTEYRLSSSEQSNASTFEVLKGKVAVSGEQKTQLLPARFGTRVEVGKPPLPPRELLPPPTLDTLPEKIQQLNWPVTWQSLKGAERYRAEISQHADFLSPLWQQQISTARVPLPDLPDGDYFFRVRGIDEIDLEGINQTIRLTLDARPQPPVPLSPNNAGVFRGNLPNLSWSASADASAYRLQIAQDAEFNQLLIDQNNLSETGFATTALKQAGKYYWRLYSISESGEQGPVSDVRQWEVKLIPDKPEASIAATESGITTSWRAGIAGQTYQIQLATDTEFKELLNNESLKEPNWQLQPVTGQVRYFRVRYIEPDGYEGPWGATQRIDPTPDNSWIYTILTGVLGILLI
ncbi:FecR domain-containing protein [Sedimenticola selenatireducens]|uniref:LysM peptidoglycan-binding domain-containing protein n=1 Tax=Sedimenticola selenatireducens TaxID=191960 RepID=A0A558DM09_9GAMM|nr:FecR domain-containing protein [Sedimenticola selenatireducens]TVO78695.1 LysM peptidoglycan-binding domain-containing protein [Sedimenticola selenatireducens]TVT62057.1 MAG: LysM peptidoglycan-binding domain-containing protein [Sedimenticola selenatireducens]